MARKLKYNFLTLPSVAGHADWQSTPGTPDLSFTRATAAWDTDAEGYIRQYQIGEARFTGATWSENLQRYSETQEDVWYSTVNTTVSDASDTYGSIDLSLITDDATNARHEVASYNDYTSESVKDLTFSVYVKAGTGDFVTMSLRNATSPSVFNIATGAWATEAANYSEHHVESLGDGVYRIGITYTGGDSNFNDAIVGIAQDGTTISYVGTGDTVYIGGWQVERVGGKADKSPSTYITTTTLPVTSLSGTSPLGLKIEPARTNIGTHSEDVTNWSVSGVTRTADQAVSPDGSTTADELIEDGAATRHEAFSGYAVSASDYTFSVFAKANTRTNIQLWSSGDATTFATFNLSTGAVTASAGGANGIEDMGNGWYRCWAVFTMASATTYNFYTTLQDSPTATRAASYTGDGSSSLYVWGRQIELGAQPSSYIPTGASSVTRNADDVLTTDVAWYSQDAGTFYYAGSNQFANNPASIAFFEASDNSSSDRFVVWSNAANNLRTDIVASGGDNATISDGNIRFDDTLFRVAVGLDTNDCAMYADGTSLGTDNTVGLITNVTTLNLGTRFDETQHLNGHIAELVYWDERFVDNVLAEVSNGDFSNTEDQVFIRKKARDRFRRRYRRT